jgi:hypothetical protein
VGRLRVWRWGDEDKGTRRDGDKGIDEIEGLMRLRVLL